MKTFLILYNSRTKGDENIEGIPERIHGKRKISAKV